MKSTVRKFTAAQYLLRVCELGVSWDMMPHLTVGMILDMATERMNDRESYAFKADQGDIDSFFG